MAERRRACGPTLLRFAIRSTLSYRRGPRIDHAAGDQADNNQHDREFNEGEALMAIRKQARRLKCRFGAIFHRSSAFVNFGLQHSSAKIGAHAVVGRIGLARGGTGVVALRRSRRDVQPCGDKPGG